MPLYLEDYGNVLNSKYLILAANTYPPYLNSYLINM